MTLDLKSSILPLYKLDIENLREYILIQQNLLLI